MKKLVRLFLFVSLVWNTSAEETFQFTTTVTATNDANSIAAKGTLLVTSNHVAYKFDTFVGQYVRASIHGPSSVGSDAPVIIDFGEMLVCGFNINYCGFRGEFDLTPSQTARMQTGLFYVEMNNSFRGQIQFVGAYNFRETNVIQFTSFIDGENPTSGSPRYVRWGRAKYGLTGNQFSYEISLPASYGPYPVVIFDPSGGWQSERPVFNIGTLNCQPIDSADRPADAEGLELLPRCVTRGSFCTPDALIPQLLAGEWQLRVEYTTTGMSYRGAILPVDSDSDGVPD